MDTACTYSTVLGPACASSAGKKTATVASMTTPNAQIAPTEQAFITNTASTQAYAKTAQSNTAHFVRMITQDALLVLTALDLMKQDNAKSAKIQTAHNVQRTTQSALHAKTTMAWTRLEHALHATKNATSAQQTIPSVTSAMVALA